MSEIFENILFENNEMKLKIEELNKKLAIAEIQLLQYKNLRQSFYRVIDYVLGEDYYNMGMDVYTCDRIACEDIIQQFKRNKKRRRNYVK